MRVSLLRRRAMVFLAAAVVGLLPETALARAAWKVEIDRLLPGRGMGVAVAEEGKVLYVRFAAPGRVPASNQKLVMSMAAFDALGTERRLATVAAVSATDGGVVPGDLWILGEGDPGVASGPRYDRDLPFRATRLAELARRIKAAGVAQIDGRVVGSTSYFAHDWWAPGWKPDFPSEEVPLPSALTVDGNVEGDLHVDDPELRAARALTKHLRDIGVPVAGAARAAPAPAGLIRVAEVQSVPLRVLIRYTNRKSSNFASELIGKLLGAELRGAPGTIAKGAAAVASWAAGHGVELVAQDASGLSYKNRISPRGLVNLLGVAEDEPWGTVLRAALPRGGEGTLEDRLAGVRVRAKTGTLEGISALSGWVWLERRDTWAEFSILSQGLSKTSASWIEDRIVRILESRAR